MPSASTITIDTSADVDTKVTTFEDKKEEKDDIFTKKSTIDESHARGARLLGKMIISLRQNQQYKLFMALDSVVESYFKNDILTLVVSDPNKYETLKRPQDFDILKNLLDTISSGTMLRLDFREVYTLDKDSLKAYLREEFGKIFVEKGE